MSNPVCISPLKFYDSLAKQSHRKSYAYGHISPLITKTGWIPAFQFIIPTQLYADSTGIFSVHICDAKTDKIVASYTLPFNYEVRTIDGYKVFINTGKKAIPVSITEYNAFTGNLDNDGYISIYSNASYIIIPVKANEALQLKAANVTKLAFVKSFVLNPELPYTLDLCDGTTVVPLQNGASYNRNIPSDAKYLLLSKTTSSGADALPIKLIIGTRDYLNLVISEGLYYIKITSDNSGIWTYYSEVFCFDNVTKDCLELEYWNETGNFAVKNGVIAFPTDFHFKLLLKGEIGKPEYNFEEESTKRLGYVYVESQVSKKTYKFNTIVPEYICDALRLVRLCDNKIIRCKDDEYEAISFEMEADWQTQGDLASVTCEFETDNVIANIGGFVPDKLGGDYNNDYNEDFDKE